MMNIRCKCNVNVTVCEMDITSVTAECTIAYTRMLGDIYSILYSADLFRRVYISASGSSCDFYRVYKYYNTNVKVFLLLKGFKTEYHSKSELFSRYSNPCMENTYAQKYIPIENHFSQTLAAFLEEGNILPIAFRKMFEFSSSPKRTSSPRKGICSVQLQR